jgi:hypothetical protein
MDNGELCPVCQSLPGIRRCLDGLLRCPDCARASDAVFARRSQGAVLRSRLPEVVDDFLARAGLSELERTFVLEDVTPEILALLGDRTLPLGSKILPTRGFGFAGSPGIGKTGALAATLRRYVAARLDRDLEDQGKDALRRWFVWLSWPETVNRLRVASFGDGGIREIDAFVAEAVAVDVLVLDDLGAERIKGSYIDDWAASQLDLIIDGRHRDARPIWYTTSLTRDELILRYGGRLFSRLCGANDLLEVPHARLPDRRMARTPAPCGPAPTGQGLRGTL